MATILVVEDNHPVAQMIQDVLEDYGYTVIVAEDGVNALEMLFHLRPDVVLSDEMMPNLEGHKLCQIMAADLRYRTVPIVLMSARSLATIPVPDTCTMFIRKPFTNAELINTITDVLGESAKTARD